MVLKKLVERLKNVKDSLERAKAKVHGMTVPELREHLRTHKAEKRAFKVELRKKEHEERAKFEKWKIEQKYKAKRKQVKSGKGGFKGSLAEFGSAMEVLGGKPSKKDAGYDPFGIFGPSTSAKPKRKRKRRKK